ncbi:MAG: hypothetical protein HOH03_10385 [Candidatus Marinimicrobia bacterium]|nr:hypothetical protein [Candidatus Neomarinimicrobiota bacterium]
MRLQFHQEDYLPHQWEFLTSPNQIKGLVTGFGGGKTHIFLTETFHNHVMLKNSTGISNGWIIYPTYDLAEELFVGPFRDLLEENYIDYEYNVSKHRFESDFGRIKIYQLQKPAYIVGAELTYIGFDEFDIESWKNCHTAWTKSIGRMRGSETVRIYFVTTPEGFGYTHKLFVEDNDGSRHLIHGKTTDNHFLPDNYIKLLRDTYDETLLKAYMDGQFVNLQSGSTYYNFNRDNNVKPVKYNPNLPIRFSVDFNVDPMVGNLSQLYSDSPRYRIFDQIKISHTEGRLLTEDACAEVHRRYPGNARYIAYPDPAGKSRGTSSRRSDHQILIDNRFELRVKRKAPSIVDSVNAVNKILPDDCVMDPKCQELIKDFEQVINKPGTRDIDKSNKLRTHASDGFRYEVDYESPINRPFYGRMPR